MTAVDVAMLTVTGGVLLVLPFAFGLRWPRRRPPRVMAPEVEQALRQAFKRVRQQGGLRVSLDQVLLHLLDTPGVAGPLQAQGVDLARLRADLEAPANPAGPEAALALERVLRRATVRVMTLRQTPSGWSPRERGPSRFRLTWRRLVRREAGAGADLPWVDGGAFLVALLEEPEGPAVEALQRQGVTRLAVTLALSHGGVDRPVRAPSAPAPGDWSLVIENDDFTPMAFVVDALRSHLGLTPAAATRLMLAVHREGRAVAGRFPAEVAAGLAQRLQEAARQAGHPLCCALEAPPSALPR